MEMEHVKLSERPGGVLTMVKEQINESGLCADGTRIRYEISDDIMTKVYEFPDDRVIAKTLSGIFEFAKKEKIESLRIGICECHGNSVTGPVVELDIEFFGNGVDRGFRERLHTLATTELLRWRRENEKGRVSDKEEFFDLDKFHTRTGTIGHSTSRDALMLLLTSKRLSRQAEQKETRIHKELIDALTIDAIMH
jgi:hypothetical protein